MARCWAVHSIQCCMLITIIVLYSLPQKLPVNSNPSRAIDISLRNFLCRFVNSKKIVELKIAELKIDILNRLQLPNDSELSETLALTGQCLAMQNVDDVEMSKCYCITNYLIPAVLLTAAGCLLIRIYETTFFFVLSRNDRDTPYAAETLSCIWQLLTCAGWIALSILIGLFLTVDSWPFVYESGGAKYFYHDPPDIWRNGFWMCAFHSAFSVFEFLAYSLLATSEFGPWQHVFRSKSSTTDAEASSGRAPSTRRAALRSNLATMSRERKNFVAEKNHKKLSLPSQVNKSTKSGEHSAQSQTGFVQPKDIQVITSEPADIETDNPGTQYFLCSTYKGNRAFRRNN